MAARSWCAASGPISRRTPITSKSSYRTTAAGPGSRPSSPSSPGYTREDHRAPPVAAAALARGLDGRLTAPGGCLAPLAINLRAHALVTLVRIGVGAVLDGHRCCKQVIGLAKHVGQIARVGIGNRRRLIAMDHDARRIAAALVRVAQLDAPPAHQRRLVHRE